MPMRRATNTPATIHAVFSGRAVAPVAAPVAAPDAGPGVPALAGPAGAPHRWQKRAWGESSAWQDRQLRPPSGAAHSLQKRPVPAVPQAGRVCVGDWAVTAAK